MRNKGYEIRTVRQSEFKHIAEMISSNNLDPAKQCIHSTLGYGPEDILIEMNRISANNEALFIDAAEQGTLLGVVGAEYDQSMQRAWLWGPIIKTELEWETIASSLYDRLCIELRQRIPGGVKQYDAFQNIANQRGINFYTDRGYIKLTLAHVYESSRPTSPIEVRGNLPGDVIPLPKSLQQSLIQLHENSFPGTYYTGEDLIRRVGNDRQIFIYIEHGALLGYVSPSLSADGDHGEIDFLGVAESARRRGIGRTLLMRAAKWLFDDKFAETASLTVYDDNLSARKLYESSGFKQLYTGQGLRKFV